MLKAAYSPVQLNHKQFGLSFRLKHNNHTKKSSFEEAVQPLFWSILDLPLVPAKTVIMYYQGKLQPLHGVNHIPQNHRGLLSHGKVCKRLMITDLATDIATHGTCRYSSMSYAEKTCICITWSVGCQDKTIQNASSENAKSRAMTPPFK